jgi:UDP:flavonoid glycosyltransferase YjiC (YdhE family)
VRVLFTFTGGRGHVEPLVPLATAARDAGHMAAFAGRPSILPAIAELGFDVFATEAAHDEPAKRIPLRAVDMEREESDFRDGFASYFARERAPRIRALCGEWRPDVVVCEETDFGGMIAAERVGLPYASVVVLAAGTFARPDLVAEPLNAVRAENDLPPDPQLSMLSRHLVLAPFPPRYRDPAFPLPATARAFRPSEPDSASSLPWTWRLEEAPTVYFTLGTAFTLEAGDLFARVLAGLRELPVNVIATVGPHIDPGEFGPLPDNFRLERYLAQSLVLPHSDIVVSHGGSGSVLGALAHGLPSVLIPLGADQPFNAARCEALGVARVLDAVRSTPETIRETVAAVVSDPSYRTAAERMRDEFSALPGPGQAVRWLEQLAT